MQILHHLNITLYTTESTEVNLHLFYFQSENTIRLGKKKVISINIPCYPVRCHFLNLPTCKPVCEEKVEEDTEILEEGERTPQGPDI